VTGRHAWPRIPYQPAAILLPCPGRPPVQPPRKDSGHKRLQRKKRARKKRGIKKSRRPHSSAAVFPAARPLPLRGLQQAGLLSQPTRLLKTGSRSGNKSVHDEYIADRALPLKSGIVVSIPVLLPRSAAKAAGNRGSKTGIKTTTRRRGAAARGDGLGRAARLRPVGTEFLAKKACRPVTSHRRHHPWNQCHDQPV